MFFCFLFSFFLVDLKDEHSRDFEDEDIESPPVKEPQPGQEEEYIDDLVSQFNKHQDIHADIGDAVSTN